MEGQIQFSLNQLMLGTITIGTLVGMAIGQPAVYHNLVFLLLALLLIALLITPWIPLLNKWSPNKTKTDTGQTQSLRENGGHFAAAATRWSDIGWILFALLISIFMCCNWTIWTTRHLSGWQVGFLLGYLVTLVGLLLGSTLIYPAVGIFHGWREQPSAIKNSQTIACLAQFQARGWCLVIGLVFFLGILQTTR